MTTLLLDASFLAYRAAYVSRAIDLDRTYEGVVYGVLQAVSKLSHEHAASRYVWAFDAHGKMKRHGVFPEYKAARRKRYEEESPEERRQRDEMGRAMRDLRTEILPAAGFRNIHYAKGYEADDLIASAALRTSDSAVVVSADHDLFQCISNRVSFYNPAQNKLITRQTFLEERGIEPWKWATVRSLTGCSTDGVPGIQGVGEKTAIKWLRGQIKPSAKVYTKIAKHAEAVLKRNLALVKLPFDGTPELPVVAEEVTNRTWLRVCKQYDCVELMSKWPYGVKRENRRRRPTRGRHAL